MTKSNKILISIFAAVCILALAGVIVFASLSGGNPDDYKSPITALSALSLCALLLVGAVLIKHFNLKLSNFTKPAALVLALVLLVRHMYLEVRLHYLQGLNMYSPFADEDILSSIIAILLVWFVYAAIFTVVFAEFFNLKTLRNITLLFSVPVLALSMIFVGVYAIGVLGEVGYSFNSTIRGGEAADIAYGLGTAGYSLGNARLWMLVVESALGIALPISHLIAGERITLPKGTRSIFTFIGIIAASILSIMPAWAPASIFGYLNSNLKTEEFTEVHRFVLYGAMIAPLLIFHALKNRREDTKRCALIYITLATTFTFIGFWTVDDFSNPTGLPLHLCHLAMFLVAICLIFKMKKLFYFCLFINVLGAAMAMLMPNMSGNVLDPSIVHFWINHYIAFFMPILLISLKLFERPKLKQWTYSLIALTVYFILMLVINAWFSNYGECDYFFINSDFIASKLGAWAERTRDIVVTFNIGDLVFTFYPLYQALFYLGYVALTVGMWFLYSLLYTLWDASEDRRLRERDYKRMKKELNEFLGGRSIHEPVSGDDSPRLVLKNFSKVYGRNKHYSVNNVSFEVHGGEVFGFLGPNGAGKSTIIKSIVGIQTITSGSIEISGFDVEKQPVQAKLHTGFVPDHYALYENLTGREYINYIADLFQVTKEYRDEVIEKFVKRFELTGSFDNQMKTYSHGMKQKITIMAALVHNPALWILDEPLTGLDPASIKEVKECMKEHAAAGNIVFFSSHIIDVVEKICDRIAIIKKGQLRAIISMKELEEQGIDLEQYYINVINNAGDEHVPLTPETKRIAKEAALK